MRKKKTDFGEKISWKTSIWKNKEVKEEDRQCTYNVILCRVRVTIFAMENQ